MIWATMALNAFAFVLRFGMNIPFWDDYELLPPLVGQERLTASWLWTSHNGHRHFLPRLILLIGYHLTGNDFRVGMYLNVAFLAATSAGLIVAAKRLRKSTCYSDAFFPLILLNEGHHANLLWSYMVAFTLGTALAGWLLITMLRSDPRSNLRSGLIQAASFGLGLFLLSLCGANGLAFVPALAAWSMVAAVLRWRSEERRGRLIAGLQVLLTLPALAVVAFYFASSTRASEHVGTSFGEVARTCLQFLSLGFGPVAESLWPYSGFVTVLLFLASVVLLVMTWFRYPGQRFGVIALLAFLAATASLTLGLGWGRSGEGALAGFQSRYVTIATPAFFGIYLSWALYGPLTSRRFIPFCLFVLSCVFLWPNTQLGLDHGRRNQAMAASLDRDISSGVPIYLLAKRCAPFLHPSQDLLAEGLRTLRSAKIGRFRALQPDPPFHEVPLAPEPARVAQGTWRKGSAHLEGIDPYLIYELPEPRHVSGIRLRYTHANRRNTQAHFRLSWRHDRQYETPPNQTYGNWALPTGEGRVTTIWVADTIKQILVQPDNQPCDFRVEEIVLLVPQRSNSPARAETSLLAPADASPFQKSR